MQGRCYGAVVLAWPLYLVYRYLLVRHPALADVCPRLAVGRSGAVTSPVRALALALVIVARGAECICKYHTHVTGCVLSRTMQLRRV